MKFELNSIINDAKNPIWQQDKRNLWILLDHTGKILQCFFMAATRLEGLARALKESENVFKCFDLKGQTIAQAAESMQTFRSKPHLTLPLLEEFYSLLPSYMISFNPAGKNLFLASVFASQNFPNAFHHDAGALAYVDNRDILAGFSGNFYDMAGDAFRKTQPPQSLLGQPAENLFVPTPGQIQHAYFEGLRGPAQEEFKPLFQGQRPWREDIGRWELSPGAPAPAAGPEGMTWSNPGERMSWLTLLSPIPLNGCDFLAELDCRVLEGSMPLFLVGDRGSGETEPDTRGYAFGVHWSRRRLFVKKYGIAVAESLKTAATSGQLRLGLSKTRRGWRFGPEGQAPLSFFDFDFIEKAHFFFSIALRPGARVLLREISVRIAPHKIQEKREDVLVRLTPRRDVFCTLNLSFNPYLSLSHPEINGFILRDVSDLRRNIVKFQKLYHTQKKEGDRLQQAVSYADDESEVFLGATPHINSLRQRAETAARSGVTILIQGETGTGKEVLSKLIHRLSPFREGPFLKVDCSALPAALLESELFGHERGAFTGAVQRKLGKFELARGGTLFLDEANNLTPEVQAKLLGFLQDFTVTRIGGERPQRLDLRIIIASNVPLEEMVKKGLFREDLFYRLNVVNFTLPPLRDRQEDIVPLARHFLHSLSSKYGKAVRGFTTEAVRKLTAYSWPGNIRELKNAVQRAVIFGEGEALGHDLLNLEGPDTARARKSGARARRRRTRLTKAEFLKILERERGNIHKTAQALDITRQGVYAMLKRLGIDINTCRGTGP